jgi:hypothetical protein
MLHCLKHRLQGVLCSKTLKALLKTLLQNTENHTASFKVVQLLNCAVWF